MNTRAGQSPIRRHAGLTAGELRGVRISAEFDLTDACEIARWQHNAALLGAPGLGHGAP